MWGLGQRPNCSTGDHFAKRAQQRRRQRSVPASNFAHPQMRPPSCSIYHSHIVAPDGRDRVAGLSVIAAFSRKQGICLCGGESGAMKTDECLRSPPTPLRSALACFLTFSASYLYYFQIQLRHLLAPFPFWRPLIPLSVALLRCVSFTLARMKNSRRILAHSYLEIVLIWYNGADDFAEPRL